MTSPRLGVIGGGQLARMMAGPAAELGVPFRVLAEAPDAAAAQVAPHVVGDHTSLEDLRAFAATVDVVTFDHEHVPTEHLRALEAAGVAVRPGPDALQYAQDKLLMREAVERLGLPNPAWAAVHTLEDVLAFGEEHGWPMILKTARGGYDGKGVLKLDSADSARAGAQDGTLGEWLGAGIAPLLAEALVPFTRELSAQVARTPSGELAAYPVVESVQTEGVCDVVTAPAPHLDPAVAAAAGDAAARLARELGVTGMVAVELFETPGVGPGFQVNELAMRPHNSGHWSMDGAVTGQFEQHVRAVLDLPLGETTPRGAGTVMKNVLGGAREDLHSGYAAALAAHPEAKVHMYGKDVKPGRKVGHVNVVADGGLSLAQALDVAESAAAVLRDGADPVPPAPEAAAGVGNGPVTQPLQDAAPVVSVVMGSDSDWPVMREAAEALRAFGVPVEVGVVSAHRMPHEMVAFGARAHERGIRVIVAGAGGAAHLPGMLASVTPLPVIGVPVRLKNLDGLDSLLSIVQMPAGVPVATVSVDGAKNAGLLAARFLAAGDSDEAARLRTALQAHADELNAQAQAKGARLKDRLAGDA